LKLVAKVIVVALVLGLAVYASTEAAVPKQLPGVAMGWTALFHVERAGAILGAIGLVALIGWRALHGEFPVKFGNVEYAVKEAASEAKELGALQERRLRTLEVLAGIRPADQLDDPE
jgi:hypothetical protein